MHDLIKSMLSLGQQNEIGFYVALTKRTSKILKWNVIMKGNKLPLLYVSYLSTMRELVGGDRSIGGRIMV